MTGPGGSPLPLHDSPAQRPSVWAPAAAPFGSTVDDFCGWAEWLDTAYELDLPDCWVLHEGLVHSLTSLWHAWRAVYAHPGSPSVAVPAHGGPVAWHTSHLLPFRDRLQRPDGLPGAGCRTRAHRPYSRTHSVAETVSVALADSSDNGLDADAVGRLGDLGTQYGPPAAVAVRYR